MEKEKTKIIIDRNCDIVYSSFYVLGLNELFGNRNVSFGELDNLPRHDGLCFLVKMGTKCVKYYIHLADSYKINEAIYDWCDVYGSVNANFTKTPEKFHDKLVPLCPSFGIRLWDFPKLYTTLCVMCLFLIP